VFCGGEEEMREARRTGYRSVLYSWKTEEEMTVGVRNVSN
jgi:hypothetical protein